MTGDHKNEESQETEQLSEQDQDEQEVSEEAPPEQEDSETLKKSLKEAEEKYVRLYADFENYKKIAARNKEELLKYANEGLISDILTVIDHLELALQHSSEKDASDALAEGVNLTLKELINVLEKNGLTAIDAIGKPFDPLIHHAMSQIESEEAEENTVVKEFRKGYMLKDRVLRASLVGVASRQTANKNQESENEQNQAIETDE